MISDSSPGDEGDASNASGVGVEESGSAEGIERARLLANTCMWRHIAPTAPDTLASYPFNDLDPFVLEADSEEDLPRVVFCGCQPGFGAVQIDGRSSMVSSTSSAHGDKDRHMIFISVPSMRKTGQAVLLDLETLQCNSISFSIGGGMTQRREEKASHEAKAAAKEAEEADKNAEMVGFRLKKRSQGPSTITFSKTEGAAASGMAENDDEDEDEDTMPDSAPGIDDDGVMDDE